MVSICLLYPYFSGYSMPQENEVDVMDVDESDDHNQHHPSALTDTGDTGRYR